MASRKLIVEVVGDSRSLENTFKRSTNASRVFGREVTGNVAKADTALQKLGRGSAGLFAAGAGFGIGAQLITQQAKAAIDVASNLNEQIDRNRVVFGSSAKAVEDWSKTTASSIGIARDQALEAVGTFGAMFDQAGRSEADAAKFSKTMVTLASDLASFNNASIEDTLVAIRSGLSGEIEPLRRFQVFLTEAAVSQRAMTDSGKDSVQQLTQGEKIMARYKLILEQTTKQQGNYADTAESLANQQRALAAQTRDLQGNIGTLLVPAMQVLTEATKIAVVNTGLLVDALKGLSSVRVPEIEIPFNITIGGSTVGDTAGNIANVLKFTPLNPLLVPTIAKSIADKFRDQAKAETPNLAAEIQQAMETMIQDALSAAGTFGITKLPDLSTGGAESADAAARARQIIAEANGNLAVVLEEQIKRRNNLKSQLENARATFKDQKKINALAIAYAQAQAAVINTQQAIATNDKNAKAAADASAESARQTAEANRKAARERAAALKLAKQAAEQARQFRALGLDATGSKAPPTIANLLKQIGQLGKRDDLTGNQQGVLSRIRKVLVDPLKKATPETRAAAKGLIDGILDELNVDKKLVGPLTKTTGLNTGKLLEGLGLGPDAARELRARLSSVNSAGLALAGDRRATGNFRGGTPVVVESHTTVNLDGKPVAKSITKQQQKNRRSNPRQKRGPNGGI